MRSHNLLHQFNISFKQRNRAPVAANLVERAVPGEPHIASGHRAHLAWQLSSTHCLISIERCWAAAVLHDGKRRRPHLRHRVRRQTCRPAPWRQGVVCQVRGVESTAIACFPPFTAGTNRGWEQSLALHCDPHIFSSAVRLALRLLTTTYRNLSPSHRDVNSLFDCPINPQATEHLLSLVGETERLSLVVKS